MAQYPIPQFIEKEGRIITFLTFRQFFILVGAGVICLFLYLLLPPVVFAILALPVALAALAIAFVKIQNESIFKIALNFFTFSIATRNYTWKQKKPVAPAKSAAPITAAADQPKEMPSSVPLVARSSKLQEIKKLVDTKR